MATGDLGFSLASSPTECGVPNGARLSCGATFEHARTYDSSNRRRRQLQAQVRPATIEPHDAHTLALHGHEPRPLPRAPTNIVFLGGARPNGARLSCGALMKDSFPNLRAPPASSAG